MNMNPNESKEMILDNGVPIIQWTLDVCKKYKLNPVIITRKEKTDLIEYCKDKATIVIHEPKGEWMDTILSSIDHWDTWNFVMLPDTRFKNTSVINDMKIYLKSGADLVFAIHKVSDPEKWGIITDKFSIEKPEDRFFPEDTMAWGLFAFWKYGNFNWDEDVEYFKDNSAKAFLLAAREKDTLHYFQDDEKIKTVRLEKFVDITRNGMIGLKQELEKTWKI